jgi:hypothetical protein
MICPKFASVLHHATLYAETKQDQDQNKGRRQSTRPTDGKIKRKKKSERHGKRKQNEGDKAQYHTKIRQDDKP